MHKAFAFVFSNKLIKNIYYMIQKLKNLKYFYTPYLLSPALFISLSLHSYMVECHLSFYVELGKIKK